MNGRRRFSSSEINLTPLLDVLFSVLFIVLLTGVVSQNALVDRHAEQAEEFETEREKFEAEREEFAAEREELGNTIRRISDELRVADGINETFRTFETQAAFITMINFVEDGGHVLKLYQGIDREEELAVIDMGVDRPQYIQNHLYSIIEGVVQEHYDVPVFVVFYRDDTAIYRREESEPIEYAMNRLMADFKQVFYQTKGEGDK